MRIFPVGGGASASYCTAATGAISAGLADLNPRLPSLVNSAAPGLGLGSGALGSGLLVEYAPAPTTLVFVLLIAPLGLDRTADVYGIAVILIAVTGLLATRPLTPGP